jgi:hypothetical protein
MIRLQRSIVERGEQRAGANPEPIRKASPIPSLQIVENNPFGRSVPRQLQTVPMGMITVGNRE